jgi:hypothetical protein
MSAPIRFKITGKAPEHHSVGVTISAPLEVEAPGRTFTIRGRYTIPENAIPSNNDTSLHNQLIITIILCDPWRAYTRRPVEIPIPASESNEQRKNGLRSGEFEFDTFEKITQFSPNQTKLMLVSIGPYVSNVLVIRSK